MFVLRLLPRKPAGEAPAGDLEAMVRDEDVNGENKRREDGCLTNEQFTGQTMMVSLNWDHLEKVSTRDCLDPAGPRGTVSIAN